MKTFYYNENKKLYKRIRWSKDIICFLILAIMFFSFFYFLLSGRTEMFRAIRTAIFLSFIITLGIETSYLIDNKEYIYVLKNNDLYVIMFQNDTYYIEGDYLTSEELRKNISDEKIEDILSNTDKYIGVSILKVEKMAHLIERKNYFHFLAVGDLSYWKAEGNFFTISNFVMDFRKKRKKLIVTKEYKDYNELLKNVRKRVKK